MTHLPSVPQVDSTFCVAYTHSRSVWQPPAMHFPATQRSKPEQSPSVWQGGWPCAFTHMYVGLIVLQSVSPAHCPQVPPRHFEPLPPQSSSVVQLVLHLLEMHATVVS